MFSLRNVVGIDEERSSNRVYFSQLASVSNTLRKQKKINSHTLR